MRLYLIRHAESSNNAKYQGSERFDERSPDPEITEMGHKQAETLAAYLVENGNEPRQHPFDLENEPHFSLTHLYCSLMTRSLLTAEYIAGQCGVAVEALENIYERKGLYEFDPEGNEVGLPGPNLHYFLERFPDVLLPDSLSEEGWWNRPVETDSEFFDRVRGSLDTIKTRHAYTNDRVGMIVHGDYIDQCINEITGTKRQFRNYEDAWSANWVFHNTSLSRIDFQNGSQNVVYLNRIDHLPSSLVTW